MRRRIWIIADDYGLSPAVDAGILALLDEERLSGTGCMTVFPDWFAAAARLRPHLAQRAVGLHLTLTDHPALTGRSPLAPDGRLPCLAELLMKTLTGRLRRPVADELDAQWHRFEAALGVPPAFLDGHHHVHFLPPVRAWLAARAAGMRRPLPFLRGSPAFPRPLGQNFTKTAQVYVLARGFAPSMRRAGFAVRGPLAGLYDWRDPACFERAVGDALARLPDGGLLMCHPGLVDGVLKARERYVEGRRTERDYLGSARFAACLEGAGVEVAHR